MFTDMWEMNNLFDSLTFYRSVVRWQKRIASYWLSFGNKNSFLPFLNMLVNLLVFSLEHLLFAGELTMSSRTVHVEAVASFCSAIRIMHMYFGQTFAKQRCRRNETVDKVLSKKISFHSQCYLGASWASCRVRKRTISFQHRRQRFDWVCISFSS